MVSLQKFLFDPHVADLFDMKSTALYERQRALVRVGLLPQATTRGRNSGGAEATAETVALIALSILVTDRLSEVDESLAQWADLRAIQWTPHEGSGMRVGRCHITGQRTLVKAIAWIINGVRPMYVVEINRKARTATITDISGDLLPSDFGKLFGGARGGVQTLRRFSGLDQLGGWLEHAEPPK